MLKSVLTKPLRMSQSHFCVLIPLTCECKAIRKSSKKASVQAPSRPPSKKLGGMRSKYQIFQDQDSEAILDIYEKDNQYATLLEDNQEEKDDPFAGVNLKRGLSGVFDIEDLVDVLRCENAQDIVVISVPKEIKYIDFICIVTGKSQKHIEAIAQFVRRVYKQKMYKTDTIPKSEGANCRDWMALDLGNISLHIFLAETRALYDLDSLWSVGPQYDPECNKQDPIADMLEHNSMYLKDLHPIE